MKERDKPDEFDAVGINVGAKLKRMNPDQQLLAESLINKVLFMGLFNELTRTTEVSDRTRLHQILVHQSPANTGTEF